MTSQTQIPYIKPNPSLCSRASLGTILIVMLLVACAPTCNDNLPETAFKAIVLSAAPNKLVVLTQGQSIKISLTENTKIINDIVPTSLVNKEIWVSGVILKPNQIQAYEVRLLNGLN